MAKYRVWRSIVSSEMKISFAYEFRFELISNPNEYPIKNRTESQEKKIVSTSTIGMGRALLLLYEY